MEKACSSETSIDFKVTSQRYIPEYTSHNPHLFFPYYENHVKQPYRIRNTFYLRMYSIMNINFSINMIG
jgi:hypothetical protein